MNKLLILLPILLLTGCQNVDGAIKLLEREGYQNIHTTGYAWFGCGEDDTYSTGFTAEKNGSPVQGVVCAGLFFKGATIRFTDL